jgi:hypothetical protein
MERRFNLPYYLPAWHDTLGMTGWQKRATRVSLISRDGEILFSVVSSSVP